MPRFLLHSVGIKQWQAAEVKGANRSNRVGTTTKKMDSITRASITTASKRALAHSKYRHTHTHSHAQRRKEPRKKNTHFPTYLQQQSPVGEGGFFSVLMLLLLLPSLQPGKAKAHHSSSEEGISIGGILLLNSFPTLSRPRCSDHGGVRKGRARKVVGSKTNEKKKPLSTAPVIPHH